VLTNINKLNYTITVKVESCQNKIRIREIKFMASAAADQIRIKYNEVRPFYEKLAKGFHGILDEDPRFPANAVYAVKHRLKSEVRLLEKIKTANSELKTGQHPISRENLQTRIKDLLGFRIICLRLSDLEKLKVYISSLEKEYELNVVSGPTEKKSFIIRPGEEKFSDLQYSGYSSIHYIVKAGKNLRMPKELRSLQAELQLRTIFEEAWGELDHKYQYEKTRAGETVPKHVMTGFRDLGLYMLACARQADHLCEAIEQLAESSKASSSVRRRKRKIASRATSPRIIAKDTTPKEHADLSQIFKLKANVIPSDRTLAYFERRLREHSYHLKKSFTAHDLQTALTNKLMTRFRAIYADVRGKQPFTGSDPSENDLDLVALVNFIIFSTVQAPRVADSGLKAHLLESEARGSVPALSPATLSDSPQIGAAPMSEQKGDIEPTSASRERDVPNPVVKEPSDVDGDAHQ
jgi:putative GTP pyrophosphokinase